MALFDAIKTSTKFKVKFLAFIYVLHLFAMLWGWPPRQNAHLFSFFVSEYSTPCQGSLSAVIRSTSLCS